MTVKHAQDELVWIDGNGVAHPLGDAATERLKSREGAFRIMPSPSHVVFMRYTGEDGRRDVEDGAVVRVAGEIVGRGSMCDIIAMVSQSGWRGELKVYSDELQRSLFFEAGNILGATTDRDDERIGQLLFKHGVIDEQQYRAILAIVDTGKRFGASAVRLGILPEETIFKFLRQQIEEIVFAILGVADGFFCFLADFDERRLSSRHAVSGVAVLMSCVARMDELHYFRPRIPSAAYVPERTPGYTDAPGEHAQVWALIDGTRSVGDIGRESHLGEFEVTKQIFSLLQSHHVVLNPPRLRGGATEVIEIANQALREIHAVMDAAGRGTALRKSVRAFVEGPHELLFHDAGPFEDGSFHASRVLRNAVRETGANDLQGYLLEMLHDYVSFVLFSAGASLGNDEEQALSRKLEPLLVKLRPSGSSAKMRLTSELMRLDRGDRG
ncbi:MAG: DUF4388 domain-containing protein [Myxococcales bacterium]|nr:DUF4388 domain-containing protein [Myxococcales bacterium]